MNNLVYINGDGATLEDEKPVIDHLYEHGYEVMFFLVENPLPFEN